MKRYLLPLLVFLTLADPAQQLSPQDLRGKVWMLNVWASWCVACRVEHPVLVEFAKTGQVPLYGLNYKDKRPDALGWLEKFGNPYLQSMSDTAGLAGIDLGVYGVPETFVLDAAGIVRYKHIGPLTADIIRDILLPVITELQAAP